MVQNLVAAGAKCSANALGIHLKQLTSISDTSVASVLHKVEQQYPRVGLSLIPVFFPGGMRAKAEEMPLWNDARSTGRGQNATIYQS